MVKPIPFPLLRFDWKMFFHVFIPKVSDWLIWHSDKHPSQFSSCLKLDVPIRTSLFHSLFACRFERHNRKQTKRGEIRIEWCGFEPSLSLFRFSTHALSRQLYISSLVRTFDAWRGVTLQHEFSCSVRCAETLGANVLKLVPAWRIMLLYLVKRW